MHLKRLLQKHYASLDNESLDQFSLDQLKAAVKMAEEAVSKSLATSLYWSTRGFILKYAAQKITQQNLVEDVRIEDAKGLQIPQNVSVQQTILT